MFFYLVLGFAALVFWLFKLNEKYYVLALFAKRLQTSDGSPIDNIVPSPKAKTIFGNTFDALGLDSIGLFARARSSAKALKKSYVEYCMGVTIYNIITAEDAELVLTDLNLITKGFVYVFLKPFLRTGLLTSTDKKWHSRRKMLTPAFHFNILGHFEEIFKNESRKFVEALKNGDSSEISLSKLIPKFTLNSVCETALGVQLDACLDGDDYRLSFEKIEECFVKRISNPFFINETIFRMIEGYKYKPHLKAVHDFSSGIIEKRRKLFEVESKNTLNQQDDDELYKKKRYAMLDTLLLAEKDGQIDHIGICEEVDTFMFEGFDTTSMGLIFGLMNLSLYPKLQERCYQETQIVLHIFDIHRDPKHWPNPDKFDPERFTLENSANRHAYAYVPFSAGQRNCIGQKFAMLEMKTLLVHMIKNFQLLPLSDPTEFTFETGLIIRSSKDVKIKLVKRK